MSEASGQRVLGTNHPCGGSAGKDGRGNETWYCNGFRGPLDTYVCLCACHEPRS